MNYLHSQTSIGSLRQTVAPTVEPITLQDAKDFLRVDQVNDDDLITSLIVGARQRVETILRRALVTQTLRLKADRFPVYCGNNAWEFNGRSIRQNAILLPMPPVQSVSSITYLDSAGASQTFDTGSYVVDTDGEPARITLAYGACWPITQCVSGAVTVTFVAGYGLADAVPEGIKTAMKFLVSHWYENRSAAADAVPPTVNAILDPFRWGSYT